MLYKSLPTNILNTYLSLSPNETYPIDRYENTSILFADMVDFTKKSLSIHPEDIYKMLKAFYADCERLADDYPGILIVKYDGDKLMAIIGAPIYIDREEGATQMVAFAQGLLKVISQPKYKLAGNPLELRIGVHSGPVVGGIISEKLPVWDVIGAAVNKASRMESNGEIGLVTISEETKNIVENYYKCYGPYYKDIKGIGREAVYTITPF
ncbi:MAG: adenylate/guanylate cyclase domain-containing protein [Gammaproteobacteria bacterium]|nr:adenylate/guanylate cyclase domain-containing protein [Gammaproteobacteria bacterium]